MAQELALATIRKNQPKLEALSVKVKKINQEIMVNFKNAVVGAKEAGRWLADMRDLLPYGHFEGYVEDHTEIAGRTARRYIQLHEKWGEIEDKLGPDAYISTINGCLKVVAPPPKSLPVRPKQAGIPTSEVCRESQEGQDKDGVGSESDEENDPEIAEAARAIREQRLSNEASSGNGDSGARTRLPKDPIKASEERIESLFGELTRELETYHSLKPNRMHFDCNQGLDHVYGDFRTWKKAPRNSS